MAKNESIFQRFELNDIQQAIFGTLMIMFIVAMTGPFPLAQLLLWINLLWLFFLLGHIETGDGLWRLM